MKTIKANEIKKLMEDEGIDEHKFDACYAYLNATGNDDLKDFEESYEGKWYNDEDCVQNVLEETGDIPADLPSYIHIDWEQTAEEIMMDYTEEDGYYFRNI